jgi:HEAT repeat protein
MGMDFLALMKYHGPNLHLAAMLCRLQLGSPQELKIARDLMDTLGVRCKERNPAGWESADGASLGSTFRPNLPDMGVSWWTAEEFSLTFGADTIRVYHLLRWHSFLTDSQLQSAMLRAVTALGQLFGLTDCIITSDFNPVDSAFFKGMTFDAALLTSEPEYGEVANLEDLYLNYPEETGLTFKTQQGWQSIDHIWDSVGYWRFRWSPEIGADHPWPPVPRRPLSPLFVEGPRRDIDPEALEGLLHDLRYEVRRKQEKAADALRELGPVAQAAVPTLIEALGKSWPTVRKRVALALGYIGDGEEVISALQRVLEQDEVADVRHAAAEALIRLGAGVSVLRCKYDERRQQAADGLANLRQAARTAVPELLSMLLARDPVTSLKTRRSLARAIWLIGPDASTIPDLLKALRDPDELVRLWIARAFAFLGPTAASATLKLVQSLEDPADMVRSSLAWALARMGLETIPAIVESLRNGSPTLRRGAAECLGRICARDSISDLKHAEHDPSKVVRQAAAESLRRLATVGRV